MDYGGGSSHNISFGNEKASESGVYHHQNHGNHQLVHQLLRLTLLFAAIALSFVVLYRSAYPLQFLPASLYSSSSSPTSSSYHLPPSIQMEHRGKERMKLKAVLTKAATADNTVIITTLNVAWIEQGSVFDLFLKSFRAGNQTKRLLKHLVVVTLDPKAFARCSAMHSHCYALTTKGVDFSNEAYFMAPDYLKMMWRRIDFLHVVLAMGYNFIFTDADIMWFRNPLPHFYADADFQIACDYFKGDPFDLGNLPNGGFNYVRSNNKTIQFYKFWYTSRERYPGLHDQDVFNKIKYDPFIAKIGLQIRFLDTAYFGGICEPSHDFSLVCTMHANCCVGLDNKVHDLKIMLEDWKKYLSVPAPKRSSRPPSWRIPQLCGAASFDSQKSRKKGSNS